MNSRVGSLSAITQLYGYHPLSLTIHLFFIYKTLFELDNGHVHMLPALYYYMLVFKFIQFPTFKMFQNFFSFDNTPYNFTSTYDCS